MSVSPIQRPIRCPGCKTSYSVNAAGLSAVTCPNCGVQKRLERLVDSSKQGSVPESTDSPAVPEDHVPEDHVPEVHVREDQPAWRVDMGADDPDHDEFLLSPTTPRSHTKTRAASLELGTGPGIDESHALSHAGADEMTLSPPRSPRGNARSVTAGPLNGTGDFAGWPESTGGDGFGQYPRVRHYPTLEAIQRLFNLLAYAAVLIVFPYLLIYLGWIWFGDQDDVFNRLGEFSQWAVPTIFGTVVTTAGLLAISEGIKLAIDLQDNTLRMANSINRHRD